MEKCVRTSENNNFMLIHYTARLQYLTWIMPELSDFLILKDKVVLCNYKTCKLNIDTQVVEFLDLANIILLISLLEMI